MALATELPITTDRFIIGEAATMVGIYDNAITAVRKRHPANLGNVFIFVILFNSLLCILCFYFKLYIHDIIT